MVLKQWCEKVLLPALMLWELHAEAEPLWGHGGGWGALQMATCFALLEIIPRDFGVCFCQFEEKSIPFLGNGGKKKQTNTQHPNKTL